MNVEIEKMIDELAGYEPDVYYLNDSSPYRDSFKLIDDLKTNEKILRKYALDGVIDVDLEFLESITNRYSKYFYTILKSNVSLISTLSYDSFIYKIYRYILLFFMQTVYIDKLNTSILIDSILYQDIYNHLKCAEYKQMWFLIEDLTYNGNITSRQIHYLDREYTVSRLTVEIEENIEEENIEEENNEVEENNENFYSEMLAEYTYDNLPGLYDYDISDLESSDTELS